MIVGRWVAGTAKVTKTGCTCEIVVICVLLAVTRFPALTAMSPRRPLIGARPIA